MQETQLRSEPLQHAIFILLIERQTGKTRVQIPHSQLYACSEGQGQYPSRQASAVERQWDRTVPATAHVGLSTTISQADHDDKVQAFNGKDERKSQAKQEEIINPAIKRAYGTETKVRRWITRSQSKAG